jgi:hypothetical protein
MVLYVDLNPVAVTIARMTADDATAFRRAFAEILDPPSRRQVLIRTTAEELAMTDTAHDLADKALADLEALVAGAVAAGTEDAEVLASTVRLALLAVPRARAYVISDDDIADRRFRAMDADARAKYRDLQAAEAAEANQFYLAEIPKYLAINAGEIEVAEAAGAPTAITTGDQFVAVFGSRPDVLNNAAHVIIGANTLDERTKKTYGSLYASFVSSVNSDPDHGPRPAVPATVAGSGDSVRSDPVTGSTAIGSSGETVN